MHACARGIASKLVENIERLLFAPKYQHFENSAYLATDTKYKEKRIVAKSFRLEKLKDFFLFQNKKFHWKCDKFYIL